MFDFLVRHRFLEELLMSTLIGIGVYCFCATVVQGVEGMTVPETLLAQFIHPFRHLAGARASEHFDAAEGDVA